MTVREQVKHIETAALNLTRELPAYELTASTLVLSVLVALMHWYVRDNLVGRRKGHWYHLVVKALNRCLGELDDESQKSALAASTV